MPEVKPTNDPDFSQGATSFAKKAIAESSVNLSYSFPDNEPGAQSAGKVAIYDGEIILKTSNRNISSISLSIKDADNKSHEFKWTNNASDAYRNVLTFSETTARQLTITPGSLTDLYAKYGLYKNNKESYFGGTLAAIALLNKDKYDAHMKLYHPLSVPPNKNGGLNLVNTEELIFNITGKGNGNYSLNFTGKPLKFAPLYLNGVEKISAMTLRDACQ